MTVNPLGELASDLEQAGSRVQRGLLDIANKGGMNMKQDWARRWTGMRGMQHLPRAVGYDIEAGAGWVTVEVGPDKDRKQGPLGNIAEFGTSTQAPKRPAGAEVLKTEAEKVERLIADLGGRL